MSYPETYLHVSETQSGREWIITIVPNAKLDLETRVKAWIKREFCGEARLDGELTPKLEGEYYARIMTDGRPPESVVCWQSGGFYIKVA